MQEPPGKYSMLVSHGVQAVAPVTLQVSAAQDTQVALVLVLYCPALQVLGVGTQAPASTAGAASRVRLRRPGPQVVSRDETREHLAQP